MKNQSRASQYTAQILEKIGEIVEDEDFIKELEEDNNASEFMYALANLVPASVYNGLMAPEPVNVLEFNHIANRLCFQYANRAEDEK